MSAIAYLAVQAGLIVLGVSSTGSTPASQESARRIVSITCFLAGFSDRFYLSLINLLINKAVGNESNNNRPIDRLDNEPDEQSNNQPDEQSNDEPDEQSNDEPDEQSNDEPDEQSNDEPDEQSNDEPDEQPGKLKS
jgi:hypothetical protein